MKPTKHYLSHLSEFHEKEDGKDHPSFALSLLPKSQKKSEERVQADKDPILEDIDFDKLEDYIEEINC